MGGIVTAVSRSPRHTLAKPNEDSIRLVAGMGVEGDAHQGTTVKHRSRVTLNPGRAQSAPGPSDPRRIARRTAARRALSSRPARWARTSRLAASICSGSRPARGFISAPARVVEVTGLRNPCAQLDKIQKGLMAATLGRDEHGNLVRKAGIMGVVLAEGEVRPGDPIRVEPPPPPHRALAPV